MDKEVLRKQFQKDWKKYYPAEFLQRAGFHRLKCKKCGITFWSQDRERALCGDSRCTGSYEFIPRTPAKNTLDYCATWKRFAKIFDKLGYTEIPRYPVIARWRDDTWFTQASIYCFQPYVVSGEVKPPANPLIIPQPSLRFNDIENVGITSAHYVCHVHMGQHAFLQPKKFDKNKYLEHIYIWLTTGLGLPPNEIIWHEDVWAGGGNFGPCIEFFSRGLELGNQVYMQFKETSTGPKELPLQVLDMGSGLERTAWFTHGTPTSYEIAFDPVDNRYLKKAGLKQHSRLITEFSKLAGNLNINEVKDINKAWQVIAKKLDINKEELQKTILPLKAFYSILDHTRTLLFALADGALPSNSGGGYNLRFILRRALRFNEEFGWGLDLRAMMRDHAKALRPMYPQLGLSLPDVERIFEVEEEKYKKTRQQATLFLQSFLRKKKSIGRTELVKLYDSQGILPEDVQKAGQEQKVKIDIPPDFYSRVSELHTEKARGKELKTEFNLARIPETKVLYLPQNEYQQEFEARVLKIFDNRFVVLDETLFYAVAGGQSTDFGTISGCKVVSVFKQGKHIVHEVESPTFREGQIIVGKIDWQNRYALMRHHTATHIISGIARSVLGGHIWQAGSEVTPEKARLDITHFASLTPEQLAEIELKANEVELADLKLNKRIIPKDKAEAQYGFRLYQGGAVPGANLRIVEIPGIDIEACGGTHVNSTGEVGFIKILGSKKIQDGICRLEFTAGNKSVEEIQKRDKFLLDACNVFRVPPERLAKTCERFFSEWKHQRKQLRKLRKAKSTTP